MGSTVRGAAQGPLLLAAAPILALVLLASPCAAQQKWEVPAGVTVRAFRGATVRCLLFGAWSLSFPRPGWGQQTVGRVVKFEKEEAQLMQPSRAVPNATAEPSPLSSPSDAALSGNSGDSGSGGVQKAELRSALDRAEEQYRINIRNRNATEDGGLMTNPQVKPIRLMEAILLPTWPCPLEGRFGTWGEGGKWVCLLHSGVTQSPLTVSIGSNGDATFETELYNRLNAVIHTYDPTLTEAKQRYIDSLPFMTFHKAGLSGQNDIEATRKRYPRLRDAVLLTVPGLIARLNVTFIDIFKIDCDGCEHGVVEDMALHYDRTTVPFGQILMEIHFTNHLPINQKLVATLESLGYRMFHTEWNAIYKYGFEVAFIHERLTKV